MEIEQSLVRQPSDRKQYKKEIQQKFLEMKKKNVVNFIVRTLIALITTGLILLSFWWVVPMSAN